MRATPLGAQTAGGESAPPQHEHAPQAGAGAGLFPSREASGTTWLPDETPMHGRHFTWRGWEAMLHGNAFVQFLWEPGDRHRTGGFGTRQGGSLNWGMFAARRTAGAGRFGVRAMLSLEPWTVPGCGYLSFLATGEVCDGDTIHDRQHPHDLFMEVAADYDRPLRGTLRWQIYGGLSGEPAIGPGGFPHRPSAILNPIAPIAHHWLDATHITFGVVTTGVYDRRWKAEASLFNGREPDESRTDFDLAPLDSYSARLSLAPTSTLSLQVSAAHLHEAEAQIGTQPRASIDRATASASYHRTWGGGGLWATTVAWGVNSKLERVPTTVFDAVTHAALVESSLTIGDRHTWFGRAEVVEMTAHALHAHEFPTDIFTVGKLQAGYLRHFPAWKGVTPGVGGMVAVSLVPPALASRYGGRAAPGAGLFLHLR